MRVPTGVFAVPSAAPVHRAPDLRRRPFHSTLTGVAGHATLPDLVSTLGEAVRDLKISQHMRETVAAVDSAGGASHCYYLRQRRDDTDVDHTFECQLMGHALAQTEAWHYLYKQEGFLDGKISRTGQLHKAVAEVYGVQNNKLNLHLLDEGINRSKRHVFSKAIAQMYRAKQAGGFDLAHELEARCKEYFRGHDFSVDAGTVASRLYKTFKDMERPLSQALAHADGGGRSSWAAADARKQQERMGALGESVVQLYDDLGC